MKTTTKKSTIYFDPQIHKALRMKAAETDSSVSDLVNNAVRLTLSEDAEDIAAFEERASEPSLSFEDVLKDLRKLVKAFRKVDDVKLICSLNTPKDIVCAKILDHMMVNWGLNLTEPRLARIRAAGAKLWFQNIGKSRYN